MLTRSTYCDTYVDTGNLQGGHMTSTPAALISAARTRVAALLDRLWRSSPPLTAVGTLMLIAAVASSVAMLVDPRVIAGAPAWLKPFQFAVSTAVYSLTLAWVFTLRTSC